MQFCFNVLVIRKITVRYLYFKYNYLIMFNSTYVVLLQLVCPFISKKNSFIYKKNYNPK